MIQANELRIGNWVSVEKQGIIYNERILSISSYSGKFNTYEDQHFDRINTLKPIPLTEEKLTMLGFKQYTDFGIKTNIFDLMPLCGFSYDIALKQVTIFEMEEGNKISHCIKRKIEHVHELQNLYFALRGKELTITH